MRLFVVGMTALAAISMSDLRVPVRATAVAKGAWRADRAESLFVAFGNLPQFAAVGRVDVGGESVASCVLVAEGWVITDAHVVSKGDATSGVRPIRAESLSVLVGNETRRVVEVRIHPGYWPKDVAKDADGLERKGIDVALLRLSAPVKSVASAERYRGDGELGKEVAIVGYGTAGTSLSVITHPIPTGTKRGGTNVVDAVGGPVIGRNIPSFMLVTDFDAPADPTMNRIGSATPTDLEYQPVGGDSGGGVFLKDGNRWVLAGLFATATIDDHDGDLSKGLYGSLSHSTRLRVVNAWIDAVIR